MRSLTVLLLEDDSFQMMATHQMLNAFEVYDVSVAESFEAAIASLERRGQVDIAICDLQMDGRDGLDVLRHLADNALAKAAIILSSTHHDVIELAAVSTRKQGLHVLGAIQKPTSIDALHKLFQAYLALPRLDPTQLPQMQVSKTFTLEELYQVLPGEALDRQAEFSQWIAYYQPKISLDGQLQGVEALVRWEHPLHGLLAPAHFIPAVDHVELMPELTWRMLRQALSLAARVSLGDGQPLPVAVNIDPQLLALPDLRERIIALLDEAGVAASALTLEIVETARFQANPAQVESLLRLRMAGCKVSIDDFGTGISNIQRLLELPFSELKIPREFVAGLASDSRKSAIVEGSMMTAERLGLQVVVEGVEDQADFEALRRFGNPLVQGYFIAKPMSEADLLEWIAARVELKP